MRVVERKGNLGVVSGTGGLCRKIAQRVAGELDKRGGEVCRELGQTVGSFYLALVGGERGGEVVVVFQVTYERESS